MTIGESLLCVDLVAAESREALSLCHGHEIGSQMSLILSPEPSVSLPQFCHW